MCVWEGGGHLHLFFIHTADIILDGPLERGDWVRFQIQIWWGTEDLAIWWNFS